MKESTEPAVYLHIEFMNGKNKYGALEDVLNMMEFPFEIHHISEEHQYETSGDYYRNILLRVAKDDYLKFRDKLPGGDLVKPMKPEII